MKRVILRFFAMAALLFMTGCSMLSEEDVKLKDLDFTVLSEEKIPQELKSIIDEKKTGEFKLTFHDNEFLYICIGYGKQPTGGHSIAVNELYLTENAIYVNTELLGPDATEKSNQVPSYPCIVIKVDYLDKQVIFQ